MNKNIIYLAEEKEDCIVTVKVKQKTVVLRKLPKNEEIGAPLESQTPQFSFQK